jgi:hypothetical protein
MRVSLRAAQAKGDGRRGIAWTGWQARWLELSSAVAVAVVLIICTGHVWTAPLLLGPLLAVHPRW